MKPWYKRWWTTYRFRHFTLEVLVSLCLGFIVWLYIHSRDQQTLEQISIPVHIQLASHRDQFILETGESPKITVSFNGPASRIREFRRNIQRGQIQANVYYMVPEEKSKESTFCDLLQIEVSHISLPPGIVGEIVDEKTKIPVTLHRIIDRQLPIKLDYTGDARVSQIKIEPAHVLVRGPKVVLDNAHFLATQKYAFSVSEELQNSTVTGQVSLAGEIEGRGVIANPKVVTFQCRVTPRKKIYEIADIPVQFLCPPNFPWKARFGDDKMGKITLRLIGPTGDDIPPVLAFVDLTKGTFPRGRNLEPIRLQLPKDFQLVDPTNPHIGFYLEDPENPTTAHGP